MQKQSFILKQALKKRILTFVTSIKSPKLIFIPQDLLHLFNFAYQFKFDSLLQEGDKLIEFQEDDQACDQSKAPNLVFMLHPIPNALRTVKSMIVRNQVKSVTQKQYNICFIPKIDVICIQELERLNIRNKVQVTSFDFGLIPFPNRLISLELSAYCNEVDYFNSCVEGLLRLCKANGHFRRIVGKGDRAQLILKHFQKRVQQQLSNESQRDDSLLIVIDRKIDLITPLLTGHSYEALIDHFFGINLTSIKIPQKFLGGNGNKLEPYRLYNRDKVYDDLASMDIVDNLKQLQNLRVQFKSQVTKKKQDAKTAEQISEVTSNWGVKYEQTNNHLSITNYMLNVMSQEMHFRNLINIQMQILETGKTVLQQFHYLTLNYPPQHILKLICLYSQIYPSTNFYTRYQKQLLEIMVGNFSNQHINSFYQLQKAGLLKNSKIKNKWEQICQTYDLLPLQPHSYTKVYIKYSALSVRFIELLIKGRLSPQASALLGRENYIKGLQKEGKALKQLFIFFIGGITYGQISCLRILEKQLGIKIFIITTNLLSRADLVKKELWRQSL